MTINGARVFEHRAFKSISDYASVPATSLRVQVVRTGNALADDPMVMNVAVSLAAQNGYTLILLPNAEQPRSVLLQDDNQLPGQSAVRFRFVHLASDIQSVHAIVLSGTEIISSTAFREASGYAKLEPGQPLVVWRDANDAQVSSSHIKLEPDTVYSFFLFADSNRSTIGISVDAQGVRYLLPTTGGESEWSETTSPRLPR